MVAAAIYNSNRTDGRVIEPQVLMAYRRAREDTPTTAREQGTPAVILAPVPAQGMRWAVKGERPPSRYGPQNPDMLVHRLDRAAGRKTSWPTQVN
jgi:hypothetical protein